MRRHASIAISVTALVVAVLGSTPVGEAAMNQLVPRNSVGPQHLKRNAVTASKIAPKAVRTAHVLDGSLLAVDFKSGQIPQGPKGDKGDRGEKGERGEPGPTEGVSAVDASPPVPATLTNQYTLANELVAMFTTTRAGRLLLHKDVTGNIDCPSAGYAWWFLTIDETAVPGSVRIIPDGTSSQSFSLVGVTAQSVPAGQHTLSIGAMCSTGAAGQTSAIVYSGGSAVVLG
jgi:hypothetical protein